jgi:hypothetical protein
MLSITTSTVYHVSVRLYSADVPAFLSGIDAKVSIYAGEENEPLRVFHVPIEDQDTEENVHWNVFCVNGNLGLHHGIYEMGYTQAATPSQLFTCSSDVEDMRVQTEAFAGSLSDDTQAALDALWPA